MAESLAIVSVVASIVQLVDFSTRVVSRLDEFYSFTKEVPESFRHVKTELPLLATTLAKLERAISTTSVASKSTKALVPVIAGCNEQVTQLEAILEKTLPEANDSFRIKSKKAIVSVHYDSKVEGITKTLRNYVGILTFYYAAASSTLQPLTDAKLCQIRQWLSAPDPSTNYQNALKLRESDTGLWFLKSDAYTTWNGAAKTPLWLHGIPGCGKTILSSTVLLDIHKHCQDDPGKVIAYFFFDFNDPKKQHPEMMVRSLICQLSQQSIKIPSSLDALFSSCESGQRQPSIHALMDVLQAMMKDLLQIYVVLDALDECAQRVELMEMFEMMVKWKAPNLHILLTSRKERVIQSSLEGCVDPQNSICLQSKVVDKDIQHYVQQRLLNDKALSKWGKDIALRQEIQTALKEGSKGMFRWAVCQLDTLGKCRNRAMLRKALAALPPTLNTTYDRILCAIAKEDVNYATRMLQWLAFSARPLAVDEVAEVIAIDVARDPAFNQEEVLEDPMEALDICSSLITITTDDIDIESTRQVAVLAHYSVKEYLVSDEIQRGQAARYSLQSAACHSTIAKACLGYLGQFQKPEPLPEDTLGEYKLAQYSAEFWTSHARKAGDQAVETSQAALHLLSKDNAAYLNWIRIHDPENPCKQSHWKKKNFKLGIEEIPSPIYYAALCGLAEVTRLLLKEGADVNAQGGNYGHALQAASAEGHEAVVKLLVDKGADVNARDIDCSHALQSASLNGHEAVVRLLLDNGANINTQGGFYGNALQASSLFGCEAVVKLLLEEGADVNAQGGDYGHALQAASLNGHEAVVRLLLDNGADINAQGECWHNALQAASAEGHEAVVRLLLDNGADINAQGEGEEYENALQAALWEGHEAIVRLLVERGADVNALDEEDSNELHKVLASGQETVVSLPRDKSTVT